MDHLELQSSSGSGEGQFDFGRLVTVYVNGQFESHLWDICERFSRLDLGNKTPKWVEVPDEGRRRQRKRKRSFGIHCSLLPGGGCAESSHSATTPSLSYQAVPP